METITGKVRTIPEGKEFGFISTNGVDYFFHRSDFNGHWNDMVEDLAMGQTVKVEFTITQSQKGPRAANVTRINFPNAGR